MGEIGGAHSTYIDDKFVQKFGGKPSGGGGNTWRKYYDKSARLGSLNEMADWVVMNVSRF